MKKDPGRKEIFAKAGIRKERGLGQLQGKSSVYKWRDWVWVVLERVQIQNGEEQNTWVSRRESLN